MNYEQTSMDLSEDVVDVEEYVAPVTQGRKRAIPLKVFVQTIWVIMDDEMGTVTEHTDGGVTIPAAEWPSFYERWATDFATLQASVAGS